MDGLKRTGLYDLHVELGAKMVQFAGYEMPVQYPLGVMKEHLATRETAGVFDVSHMGQILIKGPSPAAALERLVPQSVQGLVTGRQRYGFLTNDAGGIIDDLMIAALDPAHLQVVVNAANKDSVLAYMQAAMPGHEVAMVGERCLIALQGPQAERIGATLLPGVAEMRFMDCLQLDSDFGALSVSRSGYTGEDGYEISVEAARAPDLARAMIDAGAQPVGLGARDSLRLEAGLCLYGHDIDDTTSPIEANLNWAIQKVRRTGGDRAGGFPGAERILRELEQGPDRLRVGLLPQGRAPMREGVPLFATEDAAGPIGHITSGGFGPSLSAPIAMGYVPRDLATPGTVLWGEVRGKRLPATVADLPFRPANYQR